MATKTYNLRFREVTVDGVIMMAPSGIARNNRNKSWQVKIEKNGEVVLKGNFSDSIYGDAKKSLNVATREMVKSLELYEQTHGKEKPASQIETAQITVRSSLMWFPSMGSLKLRLNVYDRNLKKNHAIYIGTGKSLLKKPDQTIQKLTMGLMLDAWLENGMDYESFRSQNSFCDAPEAMIKMAKEIYDQRVVTYHKLQD